jgi:hypothetical protein
VCGSEGDENRKGEVVCKCEMEAKVGGEIEMDEKGGGRVEEEGTVYDGQEGVEVGEVDWCCCLGQKYRLSCVGCVSSLGDDLSFPG